MLMDNVKATVRDKPSSNVAKKLSEGRRVDASELQLLHMTCLGR